MTLLLKHVFCCLLNHKSELDLQKLSKKRSKDISISIMEQEKATGL